MIGKLSKGKGASGLIRYLLAAHDHNGDARERIAVVGGTLTGRDEHQLAEEFAHFHALRPRLGLHIAHQSLRLAPQDRRLSDDEWASLAAEWAAGMGFEAYVTVCHGDDHAHIAASRVRLDGTVARDSHDWRRSEQLVRQIEKRFGLTKVEASHLLEPVRSVAHRKAPDMARIADAERGGAAAAEQLADLIESQLGEAITVTQFVQTLETAGVIVRPNLASTGKLNGFSYELDGQIITAKALGRGFTFSNLTKRGLDYEPNRDVAALNSARTRAALRQIGAADADSDAVAVGSADAERGAQKPEKHNPRGFGIESASAGAVDGLFNRGDTADVDPHRHQSASRAQVSAQFGRANQSANGGAVVRTPNQDAETRSAGRQNRADDADLDAAGSDQSLDSSNSGGGHRHNVGVLAGTPGRVSVARWAQPGPLARRLQDVAATPPDARTELAVRTQLVAMGALEFEVGVIPLKGAKNGLRPEKTREWDLEQVIGSLGWLRRQNAAGYDIYIRPAPRSDGLCHPLIFVDDLTAEMVAKLRAEGFEPSVVVESSPSNFQAWVCIGDEPITRSEATEAAQYLAEQFGGDPNSTDWRHYGRLAGFTNRKPSRTLENGHQPFCRLREALAVFATKGAELLKWVRALIFERAEQETRAADLAARQAVQRARDAAKFVEPGELEHAIAAFLQVRSKLSATKQDGSPDESKRDFGAAVRMLGRYRPEQVAAALRRASPDIETRHSEPDVYVDRTIQSAMRERQRVQASHAEQVRSAFLYPALHPTKNKKGSQ